jgi:hypothetical protein
MAAADAAQEDACRAHQSHKETLVAMLDLLAPSCIEPLMRAGTEQSGDGGEEADGGSAGSPSAAVGGLADADVFHRLRMSIASSREVDRAGAGAALARLTRVLGNGVYAAECAAQMQAALQQRTQAAHARAAHDAAALAADAESARAQVRSGSSAAALPLARYVTLSTCRLRSCMRL